METLKSQLELLQQKIVEYEGGARGTTDLDIEKDEVPFLQIYRDISILFQSPSLWSSSASYRLPITSICLNDVGSKWASNAASTARRKRLGRAERRFHRKSSVSLADPTESGGRKEQADGCNAGKRISVHSVFAVMSLEVSFEILVVCTAFELQYNVVCNTYSLQSVKRKKASVKYRTWT